MNTNDGMKNKIAVVTGATSGIGLHTTLAFARLGAFVIGVGRTQERCAQAQKTVESALPHADVCYLTADLSLLSQVSQLSSHIYEEIDTRGSKSLDILVNNAGIFSESYVKTHEGMELTMAVNHFAPFLLTNQLIPLLAASRSGRVITLSSASHYRTFLDIQHLNTPVFYFGLWAYKVSKLANVLFTREFNRRMKEHGVRAFAVDPGLVNTDIGAKRAKGLVRLFWQLRARSGVHPDVPVQTILHLANDALVCNEYDVYWYDSRPVSPSRQALRDDLAGDLWDFSCKACGLIEK